jgi:hypothetical protein
MLSFRNWPEEDVRSISARALVVVGDHDVVRPEGAVDLFHLLHDARLCILPGSHGEYFGEIMSQHADSKVPELFVLLLEEFLSGHDK